MDVRPLDAEPVDRWTVGLCTLDDGRLDAGRWTLHVGRVTLDVSRWTLDVTLDAFIGHRELDIGHWTLLCVVGRCWTLLDVGRSAVGAFGRWDV